MPSYTRSALYPDYKHPPEGGYRKTRRHQGPRTTEPWRVRFVIDISAVLCPGPVDLAGATVSIVGRCVVGEVTGANRDWCLRQAEDLATKLGHDHRPLMVKVGRDIGPAVAVPYERGAPGVVAVGRAHVVDGGAMRAIVSVPR